MELRLEDGRYVPTGHMALERVSGAEELLQRVIMKLRVPRGSFYPRPDYGSRLHRLYSVKAAMRESFARQFIQEALADETGLALDFLEISYLAEDEMSISAVFTYDGGVTLSVETRI